MNEPGRPLSPHLSIYSWPITMILSILHRASGVALSIGLLGLVAWLVSATLDGDTYGRLAELFGSPFGAFARFGLTAAFFLHLGNGIRHLVWDAGYGFDRSQASASGWGVVLFAVAASAAYWWLL